MSEINSPDLPPLLSRDCPFCGRVVPQGRYCGSCGADLALEDEVRRARYRIHAHTADPERSAYRFGLISNFFFHHDRRSQRSFHLAILLILIAIATFSAFRLEAPLIAITVTGIPIALVGYALQTRALNSERGPAILALLIGAITGFLWAQVSGAYVSRLLISTLFPSLTSHDSLVAAIAVPVVMQAGMIIPVVLVLPREHQSAKTIVGALLGGVGAVGFVIAATLTNLWPDISTGLVSHRSIGLLFAGALTQGILEPFTGVSLSAVIGATLWIRYREFRELGRANGTLSVSPVLPLLTAFGVQIALGFADIARLDPWWLVAVHLTMLVLVLYGARIAMHYVMLVAEREFVVGAPRICPQCLFLVPSMSFCPNCGVAEAAIVSSLRAIVPRERPAPLTPWPLAPIGLGGSNYLSRYPIELSAQMVPQAIVQHRRIFLLIVGAIAAAILLISVASVLVAPSPVTKCKGFLCSIVPISTPVTEQCHGTQCDSAEALAVGTVDGNQFTSSRFHYQATYADEPGNGLNWTSRSTNDLLVLSIARGAQPVGNIEIGGILAGGRTASALLAAEMHSLYPGATRSYALPNAMVGYMSGVGGVYDYYLQGGTALSVHERVIMLVAIHRGLAILVQVVGNYQAFSANGLNDGRPSIADSAAATIADPVVNSVVWAP